MCFLYLTIDPLLCNTFCGLFSFTHVIFSIYVIVFVALPGTFYLNSIPVLCFTVVRHTINQIYKKWENI